MEFELKMLAKSLFKDCKSFQEKQHRLIDYGMRLSNKLKRSLITSDFNVPGRVSHSTITIYFTNITNYFNSFGKIDFKLLISEKELFRGFRGEDLNSQQERCQRLINYGNWLSNKLGRPLVQADFELAGRVSLSPIKKYFGSLTNYFNSCGFLPAQRKRKMADSEMKEFLKNKATITEKGCWITDYWKTSCPEGRIKIRYKGKMRSLYRVAYTLFKGNISDGLKATHSCDNARCYNPDHIVPDTQKRNMEGAAKRGRMKGPTGKHRERHGITNPEDKEALLNFVKQHIEVTEKDEWIFPTPPSQVYPIITINKKRYTLPRLMLANKLGKKYEEVDTTCHRLPDDSRPDKRDVNPDHLFEGTHSENILDTSKYHKGYKLDVDEVNQIRDASAKADFSEWGSKISFDKKWATKFNVNKQCITNIRIGKTWKTKVQSSF